MSFKFVKSLGALIEKLPFTIQRFVFYKTEWFLDFYYHQKAKYYILSYPKCGRTWLRFMLGYIFASHFQINRSIRRNLLELDTLSSYNNKIPMIRIIHDDNAHLKSPNELKISKFEFRNKKVILLVRDPRDVLVSYYYHKKFRERSYFKDISSFTREETGSIETIIKYYSIWMMNYNVPKDLLIVRYEDLHHQPEIELRKILDFFRIKSIDDKLVNRAVRYTKLENMRKIEMQQNVLSFRLSPTNPYNEHSYKTREGKIGGYKNHLSMDDIKFLESKISINVMKFYHYQI